MFFESLPGGHEVGTEQLMKGMDRNRECQQSFTEHAASGPLPEPRLSVLQGHQHRGTEDPAFFYHASVEIPSQRRLPVLEIQGRRGREENLLCGTVRGVGLANGLAQENLPLSVADLQRTREPTGKLRELVVEKRHAALDGVRHLHAVAEAIQDVAGQLCPETRSPARRRELHVVARCSSGSKSPMPLRHSRDSTARVERPLFNARRAG